MHNTLVDELRMRNWTDGDFNYAGTSPPYVRVGIQWTKWQSVFEPMVNRHRRQLPIRSIIGNRPFQILYNIYKEIELGQWIVNQNSYPFNQDVGVIKFNLSEMIVKELSSSNTFIVSYGALTAAKGIIFRNN